MQLSCSIPRVCNVAQLFPINCHAMTLDRRKKTRADLLPHPDDAIDRRRVAQQLDCFESSSLDIGQIAQIAVMAVTVQLIQPGLQLVEQL